MTETAAPPTLQRAISVSHGFFVRVPLSVSIDALAERFSNDGLGQRFEAGVVRATQVFGNSLRVDRKSEDILRATGVFRDPYVFSSEYLLLQGHDYRLDSMAILRLFPGGVGGFVRVTDRREVDVNQNLPFASLDAFASAVYGVLRPEAREIAEVPQRSACRRVIDTVRRRDPLGESYREFVVYSLVSSAPNLLLGDEGIEEGKTKEFLGSSDPHAQEYRAAFREMDTPETVHHWNQVRAISPGFDGYMNFHWGLLIGVKGEPRRMFSVNYGELSLPDASRDVCTTISHHLVEAFASRLTTRTP